MVLISFKFEQWVLRYEPIEPRHVTSNNVVFLTSVESDEPVQPPFKFRIFKMMYGRNLNRHRVFKRLAKVLIRLRICAGWSEPMLVAHTTFFMQTKTLIRLS